MDIAFFRTLCNIRDFSRSVCVVRRGSDLLVCTDRASVVDDVSLVPPGTFATGWQNASGENGQWHTWKSVEACTSLPDPCWLNKASDLTLYSANTDNAAWSSSLDHDAFTQSVQSMQEDMKRGEYFLANLTRTIEYTETIDPIYVAMMSCVLHDTPFRFFYHDDQLTLLGLSPERFLKIENGTITCEPMKGTAVDESDLLNNIKEHEENTMMIDLVRSDLSRVCEATSIRVVNRNHISLHPGLAQMSSVVEGSLQESVSLTDAVKQMMPIASVTGTPKPYVVKKIPTYETRERGIYCGAYGWIDTGSDTCDLAVGIRTIEMTPSHAQIGTGAGITLQSDPESEWRETELKASRLT
ncbi:MAG TPA: chorismate-binding protein, partial [Acidimicrobiia bacterium]|nr:chorismate-binding protein [Acidimicrobiia bacterium]